MKPGPSAASITCLPIASPGGRAAATASGAGASPATTSSSRIFCGGLKKCMPTTRSGAGTPAASAVTLSDEVFVASTQSARDVAASRLKSSRLTLEVLGRGLDDQVADGEGGEVGRGSGPGGASLNASVLGS